MGKFKRGMIVKIRDHDRYDGQFGVVLSEGTANCTVELENGEAPTFQFGHLLTEESNGGDWGTPPTSLMARSRELMETEAAAA